MRKTKVTIKRITPPVSNRKKFSITEILDAAEKVRRAVEREETKYGGPKLAGI